MLIALEKLVLDWDLYPRKNTDATQVRRMLAALKAGEEFPPMLVGKPTMKVVDGFHRHKVYSRAKVAQVSVELKPYHDDAEMLLDAMALNSRHGVPLEPMDQVRAYLLAQDLGIEPLRIAQALAVPVETLGEMMATRIATGPDGLPMILKRTISGQVGRRLSKAQSEVNDRLVGMRPEYYLGRVVDLVRHRLLDLNNENVVALLRELKKLLDGLEEKGALRKVTAA